LPSPVPQRIAIVSSIVALLAIFIAGYFGYQEYTRTNAERAVGYTSDFETGQTTLNKLESLVDLFSIEEPAYDMLALNLFNSLTIDERMSIFEHSNNRRVRTLQYELADEIYYYLGDTDENNAVLAAISRAMEDPYTYLRDEISPWLDGRDALHKGEHAVAEILLSEAIRENPANPGVWFDRARAYISLGPVYYPNGLNDLEEVIVLTQEKSLLPIWNTAVRNLFNVSASPDLRAHWELFQADYPVLTELVTFPEVLIPAGELLMGSTADQALAECEKFRDDCQRDWFTNEEPPHPVGLSDFYIDQFEVTNARYAECVVAGACSEPRDFSSYSRDRYYDDPAYADYPVIYVSWFDANTYCEWRGARLPSESEWEKAARGTDGRIYPWGNEFDSSLANFCDDNCAFDWANTDFDDGYSDTSPVGTYPDGVSPYGVHDMSGNVWEWTADWYGERYYQDSPYENPAGPEEGQDRVLRGGAWNVSENFVRASSRNWSEPSYTNYFVGFRCARSLP
jgi:formylglycine-generating enzyme required for sulfatase activity